MAGLQKYISEVKAYILNELLAVRRILYHKILDYRILYIKFDIDKGKIERLNVEELRQWLLGVLDKHYKDIFNDWNSKTMGAILIDLRYKEIMGSNWVWSLFLILVSIFFENPWFIVLSVIFYILGGYFVVKKIQPKILKFIPLELPSQFL